MAPPPRTKTGAALDRPVRQVVIDSREVGPGDLFVALLGAHDDGARFAGDAYARGALAVLTHRPPAIDAAQRAARRALAGGGEGGPFVALVVPDPLAALGQAALAWRGCHPTTTVVGVTGSVGKTTTREAIAAVLGTHLPVLVSPRSYNNEIGLPLTLLRLRPAHRAAVLEMGMYARGEIADLARMARPTIGVVTMVAPVHLERLGSIAEITAAKAELVEALPAHGVAVLNGDDPLVHAMASRTAARPIFFGLDAGNEWRASEIEVRGLDGLAFTLEHGSRRAHVESAVVGRHTVYALLAAAAVASSLDPTGPGDGRGAMSFDEIAHALAGVRLAERQRLVEGPGGRLVIDDAWNASPPSMVAALDVLAAVPARHVAVLGEMRELGSLAEAGHRAVGRHAAEVLGTDGVLVTVGTDGALMADEARRAGMPAARVAAVAGREDVPARLAPLLRPGDAVLVKGSRALGLEETVRWLSEPGGAG